jgi:hypothetical protein
VVAEYEICFKYCSRGLPKEIFLDIAPSRMFSTNSLCLIICPIHEWRLFCYKFLKVIFLVSPFVKLHHSLFYTSILFLTFFSSTLFQTHLRPFLHVLLGPMFLIHKEQHSKYNFISFFFYFPSKLFEQCSCFLLLNINLASLIGCIVFFIFPIFFEYTTEELEFWYLL